MPPCDCRSYPPSLSIKQAVSQHGFKTLNVNAEAGLGAMLPQSCLAEAALLIGCHKAPNLFQIQGVDEGSECVRGPDGCRFALADSVFGAGSGRCGHRGTHNKT